MSTLQRLRVVLMVLLMLPLASYGQGNPHEMFIPMPTTLQYLNDLIMADSLANGQRVDPERVYVLQRGGLYLVNTAVRNTGWTLRIKAQDSLGSKPVVFLTKNTTTNTFPGQFVNVQGSVWLKNLLVGGFIDSDTTYAVVNGMPGGLLISNTAGWDITVDSCILTNVNGNHIRTNSASRVIKLTNSIFANMGWLGSSNLGAGKVIDIRDVSCDSLIMVNCTYVNSQDRIIRHRSSTAPLKYLRFEHNTVVNNMGYHGMLALGWLGKRAIVSNNLFIDAFALGADTDAVRQAEFEEGGEKDAYGFNRMTWLISVPNDSTQFSIKNNIFSVSAQGQDFFTGNNLVGASPLTYQISRRVGSDSTNAFVKQSVALNNIPALMTRMMTWYRTPTAQGGAGKTKGTGNFNRTYDYDRRGYVYLMDTLDCGYATGLDAYTGAEGGYPVGDLNWFPAKKAEWLVDAALGVELPHNVVPAAYALAQNYPNPFNPTTGIRYQVSGVSDVKITVYDVLGREVAVLVNERKAPGTYEVRFSAKGGSASGGDGRNLASGVYFYRIVAGEFSDVKKMVLLK